MLLLTDNRKLRSKAPHYSVMTVHTAPPAFIHVAILHLRLLVLFILVCDVISDPFTMFHVVQFGVQGFFFS